MWSCRWSTRLVLSSVSLPTDLVTEAAFMRSLGSFASIVVASSVSLSADELLEEEIRALKAQGHWGFVFHPDVEMPRPAPEFLDLLCLEGRFWLPLFS